MRCALSPGIVRIERQRDEASPALEVCDGDELSGVRWHGPSAHSYCGVSEPSFAHL